MTGLTFNESMKRCVAYYLADPNRSKSAAYRAGYGGVGMTVSKVASNAARVFAHELVRAAIDHSTAKILSAAQIDAKWVLDRAVRIADFNIANFIVVQSDGSAVYDFSSATLEDWYCIGEYTVGIAPSRAPGRRYDVKGVKLKATCRLKALELISKLTASEAPPKDVTPGLNTLSIEEFKAARREMLANDDI